MSFKDDKQQNIQIELDFSSSRRRKVKPERREGQRLNRPG